jgi:hypothetical protein
MNVNAWRRAIALTVSGGVAVAALVAMALLTTGRAPFASGLTAGSPSADGAQILLTTVAVIATIATAFVLAGPRTSPSTPPDDVRR